jgi:hypothetical protein
LGAIKVGDAHSLAPLCECLTASCKAFNLANVKGMGTSDLVIRSLDDQDQQKRKEEVRSLEEISKNLLGN